VRKPNLTTEWFEDEPYFTVVCKALEMKAEVSYFVRWHLGSMTVDVPEALQSTGRAIITAEDVEGLQMGDQVCLMF
jgi:hypothetical protein